MRKKNRFRLILLGIMVTLLVTNCASSDGDDTNSGDVSDGYILFSTMTGFDTYLIDNDGDLVKSWTGSYKAANAAYLTDDLTLIRGGLTNAAKVGTFSSGGAVGGIIEEFDDDSNTIWSYTSDDDSCTLHHDFKQIDSTTVIALCWENYTYGGTDYWNEKIIKIDKDSGTIIYTLSVIDDGLATPDVSDDADFLHFNSIDYDSGSILVSSREKNELWLIDETSKTITQTLTAEDSLFGQHDASFLDNGNILVFNNSTDPSIVTEVDPSDDTIAWSYSNTYYSNHISGTQRLSNGNTLICSGVEGEFIEVSSDGEEVWSYTNAYTVTNLGTEVNTVFKIRKYDTY